jgi:hypothetical protein
MTRKLLFLLAALLACVALAFGPSLAPARAAQTPTPVVKATTASRPLTCIMGLGTRAICLSLS